MEIGVIGLGLLGSAIANRLISEGHAVCGFDINPTARASAVDFGVDVRLSADEVAVGSRLLILSLMTDDDRRQLLWGEQDLAQNLEPGTIILDTTTATPVSVREDHEKLREIGVRLIDTCISGSSQRVTESCALALVGDTEEEAAAYVDILASFTKSRFYFGGPGRGNEAKLVVNTVMGLHRLVLAEALALARAGEFDLNQMLDVLKEGDTYSAAMDAKGDKMVSGVYEPAAARLVQHAKDVGLILDYSQGLGVDLPLSRLHHEVIQRVVEMGAGDLDNAAIFKAYP